MNKYGRDCLWKTYEPLRTRHSPFYMFLLGWRAVYDRVVIKIPDIRDDIKNTKTGFEPPRISISATNLYKRTVKYWILLSPPKWRHTTNQTYLILPLFKTDYDHVARIVWTTIPYVASANVSERTINYHNFCVTSRTTLSYALRLSLPSLFLR